MIPCSENYETQKVARPNAKDAFVRVQQMR
jgi:hypothetical protein